MEKFRRIALFSLFSLIFTYAGLGVFFIFCPFEQHFDTLTFIKYWQIVDGYMGKRMPIFGMITIGTFITNLIVFFKTRKISPIFWIILACFVMIIVDVVFTAQNQTPINQYIQTLDMNNLKSEQLAQLQGLRDQINQNFGFRDYLQWAMFLLMSVTPYLLAKLEQKIK